MIKFLRWPLAALLAACSATSHIPDGDQLYIGQKKIAYTDVPATPHAAAAQEEVEAALATPPNGAIMGSSSLRSPFPYRLWIHNLCSGSESVLAKWLNKSFGKPPVLMSWVNPQLRAAVAKDALRSHGYFGAWVDYDVLTMPNPKTAKIAYRVHMGDAYTIDTLTYHHFPPAAQAMIDSTRAESLIASGTPFDVSTLDAERRRLAALFRRSGLYYYQSDYATYLADTTQAKGHVQLRLQMPDSVPDRVGRQWYLGNIDLYLRRAYNDTLAQVRRRRRLTIHYNGKRVPVRTRVLLGSARLRRGDLYSYDNHLATVNQINATGLFSAVDVNYTPRDTTPTCDTLDVAMNCVFDKPYDFYVETNLNGKTTGRLGPEIVAGVVRRNAFRGGEKLDINVHGSYEWQTGHSGEGTSSKFNSYSYGADASVEFPRLLIPFVKKRRRWAITPSTTIKASIDIMQRAGYFKRNQWSAQLVYKFQPRANVSHQLAPLILQYEYMQKTTAAFDTVLAGNPYLKVTMADRFIPMMRYTYTYSSPATRRNPIWWQITATEAANILSLGYLCAGHSWNEEGKKALNNPYAQFIKVEAAWRKTWHTGQYDQLVAHAAAGIVWAYGNARTAPYGEQFYVGGANSLRAFNVRSIGPGAYHAPTTKMAYIDQTGDVKLEFNLEWRPRLLGNLYGAVFLDAGNVWTLRDDGREGAKLQFKNLFKQLALGTGIGVRYDLDFFVVRLDWGIGLHVPYKTGFFNVGKFSDAQCINFAIGYPF